DDEATTYPDATEVCDEVDNDCDGDIDEDDADDALTWYEDGDDDGYGDADSKTTACEAPSGFVADDTDCNDDEATTYPDATEVCDEVDNDCDGDTDEGVTSSYYLDDDGDGWGDPDTSIQACEAPSTSYTSVGSDCDDTSEEAYPGGEEVCDGLDNDCDGDTDEDDASDATSWYADDDDDGLGDPEDSVTACDPPSGYVDDDSDCDDDDDGSTSILEDADCDGTITEDDCDDEDPDSTVVDEDADCDGTEDVTTLALSEASYGFVGEAAFDYAYHVAGSGDVDGDGYADLLVGAHGNDEGASYAGAAYLIVGADLSDSTMDLGDSTYKFTGDSTDYAGAGLAMAGDVDGDGRTDILIGSYGDDDGADTAGAAHLVLASSLDSDRIFELEDSDYKFTGQDEDHYAGMSVSGAGDVDDDGFDDLLVGAHEYDHDDYDEGAAYLILGGSLGSDSTMSLSEADHRFIGAYTYSEAGTLVTHAGDLDADGLADIMIGAPGDRTGGASCGAYHLVMGASLGGATDFDLGDADHTIVGESWDSGVGSKGAGAGDVDDDGFDDLLLGHVNDDTEGYNAGAAFLLLSSSLTDDTIDLGDADIKFIGSAAGDYAGIVSGAGDVDDDGHDDLLVGAQYNSSGSTSAGAVYLVLGAGLDSVATMSLDEADHIFTGEADNDFAGKHLAAAGDVDADGLDDFLVGAQYNSEGGYAAGKAYLILGSSF
ncbi:MAG: MopE-related protein, partial [Myxococcota bacterium]|nr:MopE-related protein [Myxococcota bacterium]